MDEILPEDDDLRYFKYSSNVSTSKLRKIHLSRPSASFVETPSTALSTSHSPSPSPSFLPSPSVPQRSPNKTPFFGTHRSDPSTTKELIPLDEDEDEDDEPISPRPSAFLFPKAPETWTELWNIIRPHYTADFSLFSNSQLYVKVLRFYSRHFFKTFFLSGILVCFLLAISQLPYSSGTHTYYNPYAVAFVYALFSLLSVLVSYYAFWVILYGLKRTLIILAPIVPAVIWSVSNYYIFLAVGIEPWYYGLVPLFGPIISFLAPQLVQTFP